MTYNEMDDIHTNWHHCTNVKELKINGENISSIGDINSNIIYVSKNGSDTYGNGSLGNPFLTINYAITYTKANFTLDTNNIVEIKVAPGIYEESIIDGNDYIILQAGSFNPNILLGKTVLYNTGADEDHYPLNYNGRINMHGFCIKTDTDGIFGKIARFYLFEDCRFVNGYFIERSGTTLNVYMDFRNCNSSGGKLFNLIGTADSKRFIAFRNCDMTNISEMVFGSSQGTLKLERTLLSKPTKISGGWDLLCQHSELYNDGKITFDTDGYVDIFSSIIANGIHFTTDTPETKKLVNCIFKNTPTDEGDVTADENVEFIEYSGNHQCNGIDGEIITVSKIKNVGGGQNNYRNIHEALKGSILTDTIINLEGDVEIDSPLLINPNIDVQIDGNKKWKLITTHATTLVELGLNQQLSFVNMKQITGGKKAIINGDGSTLSFVSCGRYTEPNYVNIEMNNGNISSFIYLVKTTLIGTSSPVVQINNVNPWLIIDRSFLKGSSGEPAIEWSVDADSRFRCKYTTLIHGSGSTNAPLLYTPATGRVDIAIYNSAMNAAFDSSDFHNVIGNPSITIDPQIDY